MSELDAQLAKRQKIECADNAQESGGSMAARDVIRLAFACSGSHSEKGTLVAPDFTHQLFDNEIVTELPSNFNGTMTIGIDCTDLRHNLRFSQHFSAEQQTSLLSKLERAMPDESSTDTNDENLAVLNEESRAMPPPGLVISSWPTADGQSIYELRLATAKDAGASQLLHRAEKIAVWFIETADSVDFSDERWEVVFLHITTNHSTAGKEWDFVGYMTLFSFRNPFHGTKIRVCQALVLPPWQGQGLGREMLLRIYHRVVYARDEVSELTVEDPCLGFQRLRDAVDVELLARHYPGLCAGAASLDKTAKNVDQVTDAFITPSATATAESPGDAEIARSLRITKSQAQFLDECVDFFAIVRDIMNKQSKAKECSVDNTGTEAAVDAENKGADDPVVNRGASLAACGGNRRPGSDKNSAIFTAQLEGHEDFKAFRLKVKKRLLKQDKELASLPKADMQRALTEDFAEELQRFLAVVKTAARVGLVQRE